MMGQLTPQQEQAMAILKASLHLPGGGYHALIVDLCREYLLPFQSVRAVLKTAQAEIEQQIRAAFDQVSADHLTQQYWLSLIHQSLTEQSKDNKPVMQQLLDDPAYQQVSGLMQETVMEAVDRDTLLALLAQLYESQICKPLMAMLYTTSLYWELPPELAQMNDIHRQRFSDYPQHMRATAHLYELYQQVEAKRMG